MEAGNLLRWSEMATELLWLRWESDEHLLRILMLQRLTSQDESAKSQVQQATFEIQGLGTGDVVENLVLYVA